MKTETKAHRIFVSNNNQHACLICVSYRIGFAIPAYVAKFYELITNFDNSSIKIPSEGHIFSFHEELRIFKVAATVAPQKRVNMMIWMIEQVKMAYGKESKVVVEALSKDKESE